MSVSKEIIDAVAKMQSLDLSTATEDDIRNVLKMIDGTALLTTAFPKGASIARTRCVQDFYESKILYERDISYNPNADAVRIGRVNRDGQSVFYGVSLVGSSGSVLPRVVSFSETSTMVFDKSNDELEEYTVTGRWRAEETFNIVWFIHHQQFAQPDPHIAQLRAGYEAMLSRVPNYDDCVYVNEALAAEFAKDVPRGQGYGYGITSVIGKYLLEQLGCDAIGFPSVRAEGNGLNLAIHPRVLVSGKLKLEVVLVEHAYKFDKDVIAVPYLLCNQFHPDGKFIYEEQPLMTKAQLKQEILRSRDRKASS